MSDGPLDRYVPRCAAEPPQDALPYGRWAERLRAAFLAAVATVDAEGEDLGEPGELVWHPDRTWDGRTWLAVTARTSTGLELFGHVSHPVGDSEDLAAQGDFTPETREEHPERELDLCDEVLGGWRGERGAVAAMTLVWGEALVTGGATVTAELADLVVDQCPVVEGRFSLVAPDDYRGDTLEVALWDVKGRELARESLYD